MKDVNMCCHFNGLLLCMWCHLNLCYNSFDLLLFWKSEDRNKKKLFILTRQLP
jgi:hypothetical protein